MTYPTSARSSRDVRDKNPSQTLRPSHLRRSPQSTARFADARLLTVTMPPRMPSTRVLLPRLRRAMELPHQLLAAMLRRHLERRHALCRGDSLRTCGPDIRASDIPRRPERGLESSYGVAHDVRDAVDWGRGVYASAWWIGRGGVFVALRNNRWLGSVERDVVIHVVCKRNSWVRMNGPVRAGVWDGLKSGETNIKRR